jgi:hypothetical protein
LSISGRAERLPNSTGAAFREMLVCVSPDNPVVSNR